MLKYSFCITYLFIDGEFFVKELLAIFDTRSFKKSLLEQLM